MKIEIWIAHREEEPEKTAFFKLVYLDDWNIKLIAYERDCSNNITSTKEIELTKHLATELLLALQKIIF